MGIITRRNRIKVARDAFLDRIRKKPDDAMLHDGRTAGEARAEIAAIDFETCSYSDVDRALRNGLVTNLECSICGATQEALLRIGERGGQYGASFDDVCLECLEKGTGLLREALAKDAFAP
jgi:hypothetical protein